MADLTTFKPTSQVALELRTELGYFSLQNGSLTLTSKVTDWLFDHVGHRWLWDERAGGEGDDITVTFYFEDDDAAMLFKLTWS